MAAKTINEVQRAPKQQFRTKEEVHPSFRPRNEARVAPVVDATKDVTSLLGSQANKVQQEHQVSVGMAKTIASDHLTSITEEIAHINSTMGPGDNRDVAIQRLQSSVASTSGIASGLTGDAAQAYDQLYIPGARKMASHAMSIWKDEQRDIDKAIMDKSFNDFLDSSSKMDPTTASTLMTVWNTRMIPFTKDGETGVYDKAANSVVNGIIETVTSDPSLTPEEVMAKFMNKNYLNMVETDAEGKITFNRHDPLNNAKIGKALSTIFDAGYTYKDTKSKMDAAKSEKVRNAAEARVLTVVENSDVNTEEGKAAVEEAITKWAPWLAEQGVNVKSMSADMIKSYVVSKESGGSYTVWNGGTEESRAGQDDGKGGEYTTAFGKYQFIEGTAKEYWKKAGIEGDMVHGKQTPDQQDKMYEALVKDEFAALKKIGQQPTPDNIYTMHQLGMERGARFFNNTLTVEDLSVLNDQLPKEGRHAKLKFPELDPSAVRRKWADRYRISSRPSSKMAMNKSMSKNAVKIAAKIAKQSRDSRDDALKQSDKDFDAKRTKQVSDQKAAQKLLDEKARNSGNQEDQNLADRHRKHVEDMAVNFGEEAVFTYGDIADKNIRDLKVVEDSQNDWLDTQFETAIALNAKNKQGVLANFKDITQGTDITFASKKVKEKYSNWFGKQAVMDSNQLVVQPFQEIATHIDAGLTPGTLRKSLGVIERMDEMQKANFHKSEDYAKLLKYRNSPKWNLDTAKGYPIEMRIPTGMLTAEQTVELSKYRSQQLVQTEMQAMGGDDIPGSKLAREKLINWWSNGIDSLPSEQKLSHAKRVVGAAIQDIGDLQRQMENLPELWNNRSFISAARTGLSDDQNLLLTVSMAFVRSANGEPLDPMLTSDIKRAGGAALRNEVIKDLNGDDIDYHDSAKYESFVDNHVIKGKMLPREKMEHMVAARTLVAMGKDGLIPVLLKSAPGRYTEDIGGLKGVFQSAGLDDDLVLTKYDQENFAEAIVHSMSKENFIDYNEAKNTFTQKLLDGAFTMSVDNSGVKQITFADEDGTVHNGSPTFNIDLTKLKETRSSHIDNDISAWLYVTPATAIPKLAADVADILAPEGQARYTNKKD